MTIVGSFNSMVDALQTRIERDAAFAADVSHELRTPLTTLVAAVDVLQSRADTMTPVQRQALELTAAELERFRRLLDELIQLARFDAGLPGEERQPVDVRELVEQSLARRGLPADLVSGDVDAFVVRRPDQARAGASRTLSTTRRRTAVGSSRSSSPATTTVCACMSTTQVPGSR